MRLQRCSASAKSTLGKKQGGSNVPAGKSGRGEPLAAINQSRRGSFLAAKVAHFLAATDTRCRRRSLIVTAARRLRGHSASNWRKCQKYELPAGVGSEARAELGRRDERGSPLRR